MSLFIFSGSLLLVCCATFLIHGFRCDLHRFLIAILQVAILSVGGSWLISLMYTSAFSAEGIYGHSFWGVRRFVRWQDIADAKACKLANLPWLRVYGANGKVTWLALFQVQKNEFWQEIRKHAPADSTVLRHHP
jgi:hypothetical protein